MLKGWKEKARALQMQTYALAYAYRDPRVPWYAKGWGALVVAYAFRPIDLIPDFIPVLGYLDDLVLIPLGVALAVRMIPAEVMDECREKAAERLSQGGAGSKIAAGVIALVWVAVIVWGIVSLVRMLGSSTGG